MANNALLFNAVASGAAGGIHERWLTSNQAADYVTIRNQIIGFATAVDTLIPVDSSLTVSDAALIQSITQGVLASRYPQQQSFDAIAQAIVALWTSIRNQFAAGVPFIPTGASIRYTGEITNTDTGTLALLTVDDTTTAIQFNPAADLQINAASIAIGKQCQLRVQRNNANRITLVNGAGATGFRCSGNQNLVLRSNDEVTIQGSFGGVMVFGKSGDPNYTAPLTADPAGTTITQLGDAYLYQCVIPAGGGGVADDVTLLAPAASGLSARLADCWFNCATAVVGSSIRLRDQAGGAGTAISGTLSTAATGTVRNNANGPLLGWTAATGLFCRRTDNAVSGTMYILAARSA